MIDKFTVSEVERDRLLMVYEYLKTEGEKDSRQIQRYTELGYSTVKRVIWLGKLHGVIAIVQEARGTRSALYGIGDADPEILYALPKHLEAAAEKARIESHQFYIEPKILPIKHEVAPRVIKERHPTRSPKKTGRVWVSGSSLTMV